jgi:predicted Zn finger-like uncharacterized protein
VYTQCPDCATVFRVSAEVLRAAQGDVRCGVCSTTFNALENLSEQAFKAASAEEEEAEEEAPPDDSMTVEELPASENIELSSPALAVVPDEPAPPPEAPPPDDEDVDLEFHGDAADLDRVFVVEAPPDSSDLDSTDEHPILVLDEQDEPFEEEVPAEPESVDEPELTEELEEADEPIVESIVLETPHVRTPSPTPPPPSVSPPPVAPPPVSPQTLPPVHQLASATSASSNTAPRILIPDEMRRRLAEEAAARAAAAKEFEPEEAAMPFLSRRWPWIAGVAVLGVLLLAQFVHGQRNDLAQSPAFGPLVAGIYSTFGLAPLSPSDLSAYELRQWGAASDPNAANRLLLRASIVNRASFSQPYPLLRLVLQDRFGGTLGMRDIPPADYLPGAGGTGLLGPGQRADALIRIVDPGTEAVGFELDICLPAAGGVRCANPLTTAAQ